MMVGSDTSGYEVNPPPGPSGTGIPVHRYLLVDQGVHIGEFHNLEGLSRAKAYVFCYMATVNKIKGAVAGFAPPADRGALRFCSKRWLADHASSHVWAFGGDPGKKLSENRWNALCMKEVVSNSVASDRRLGSRNHGPPKSPS